MQIQNSLASAELNYVIQPYRSTSLTEPWTFKFPFNLTEQIKSDPGAFPLTKHCWLR